MAPINGAGRVISGLSVVVQSLAADAPTMAWMPMAAPTNPPSRPRVVDSAGILGGDMTWFRTEGAA